MQSSERHCRQSRLPEVGTHGQAELYRTKLLIGTDRAADLEREYLERAGVGTVSAGAVSPPAFAHAKSFRFDESACVAEGSWRALRQLKAVLRWGTP